MTSRRGASGARRAASGRAVTIKHVAAELGLSITTISRALNGYSDVGEQTREKVLETARRLGYRPNRNAQRLVMQRTHMLAWVQSDNDLKFVDPHFVEVMAGVLRGARAGGYDVIMSSEVPENQLKVYEQYVNTHSADGFLVDLPTIGDRRIDYLLETGQPFVVHGRDHRSDRYHWVDIDNFRIFADLTRFLIANGHKRIAFVNGDEQFMFADTRHKGVMSALEETGMPAETVRFLNARHPMGHAGYKLTRRALADGDVSAIIYSSALMAVEGHAALAETGRRAGDNIAIASMDDELQYLDLSVLAGKATFARSGLQEAGMALAGQLIKACEHPGGAGGVLMPHRYEIADGMDGRELRTGA